MFAPYLSSFEKVYSNVGTPATANIGVSVTPGASNAEGSWTAMASSANIADDIFWVKVWICGGGTSAAAKNHLLDIGVDNAGGTSYTAIISNIVCGQSATAASGGRTFVFPIFIKAGSSVAARIQGSNFAAGTVRVAMFFMGRPNHPEAIRVGTFSETIGTITNSNGVSFTPGNTGAEGSWVSLGTTTNDLWWWQLCMQVDNATTTALNYYIDLAFGDDTNKHMIIEDHVFIIPSTVEIVTDSLEMFCYREVPAGSTIYIRGSCSGTAVTGFNGVAIGIGG